MVQKIIINLIARISSKTRLLAILSIVLFIYASFKVYRGLNAEIQHNKLIRLESNILYYIDIGNLSEADKLINKLEHSSDEPAPSISRDSIVTWKQYWETKRTLFKESIEKQRLKSP